MSLRLHSRLVPSFKIFNKNIKHFLSMEIELAYQFSHIVNKSTYKWLTMTWRIKENYILKMKKPILMKRKSLPIDYNLLLCLLLQFSLMTNAKSVHTRQKKHIHPPTLTYACSIHNHYWTLKGTWETFQRHLCI
jgi:hypothetical protein